jgi:hypothetical protein
MFLKGRLERDYPHHPILTTFPARMYVAPLERKAEVQHAYEEMNEAFSALDSLNWEYREKLLPNGFKIVKMKVRTFYEEDEREDVGTETIGQPASNKEEPECWVFVSFDETVSGEMKGAQGVLIWDDFEGKWVSWEESNEYHGFKEVQ